VLAPTPLPATPENIRAAQRLLDSQNRAGATELLPALRRALAMPRLENASRSIAVITDGYVDIEAEAFDLVRQNLGRANLFAFGIGSSVNRHLIEGLARAGQGEPFVVTDAESSAKMASQFRNYIVSPVLTRVGVEFSGLDAYDVEPPNVPDLFAQRPVIVFGKWRGAKSGKIRVHGITGRDPYATELDFSHATALPSADGLAHLWARTRIAQLSDLAELSSTNERVTAITHLGLTYHLLTRYTSFVAVDEVVRRTAPDLKTLKQPLPLPQGVENSAVGQNIPTSPEPATVGLMIIAGGALAFLLWNKRRLRTSSSSNRTTHENPLV
jgi:Ca-activated chloride channel family protein